MGCRLPPSDNLGSSGSGRYNRRSSRGPPGPLPDPRGARSQAVSTCSDSATTHEPLRLGLARRLSGLMQLHARNQTSTHRQVCGHSRSARELSSAACATFAFPLTCSIGDLHLTLRGLTTRRERRRAHGGASRRSTRPKTYLALVLALLPRLPERREIPPLAAPLL